MQPAHTRLAASFTRNLALAVSGDATRHCGAASAFHIASLPRGGRTEALPPRMCDRQEHALRKKKATILLGLKFPTWQACKVITKYYASPFQGQHYFSLAKRVRILGVRSVQKCASVPVLLGARRQAAANSLATPVPRSPATKKFRNCAQEGYYLCKQWSPCVASAFAYSSRSPHPDQRGWPGHRAKWPRRRWRRTQGASDHDCTRRAHIYENC